MARKSLDFSLSDLERILAERKSQAHELTKRRDQLTKELEKIELELQEIVGTKRRGPKKGASRGKRPKNERSLREILFDLLAKSKKGLTLADLEPKVVEAGYKSASKNFTNMIYQCLYNSEGLVQDPETGCYRISKDQ